MQQLPSLLATACGLGDLPYRGGAAALQGWVELQPQLQLTSYMGCLVTVAEDSTYTVSSFLYMLYS